MQAILELNIYAGHCEFAALLVALLDALLPARLCLILLY